MQTCFPPNSLKIKKSDTLRVTHKFYRRRTRFSGIALAIRPIRQPAAAARKIGRNSFVDHLKLGRKLCVSAMLKMKRMRRCIRTFGLDASDATELDDRAGVLTLDFGFARVYLRYGHFSYTPLVVRGSAMRGPSRTAENLPEERARCHEADVCRY